MSLEHDVRMADAAVEPSNGNGASPAQAALPPPVPTDWAASVRAIQGAMEAGEYTPARKLAEASAQRYPQAQELQRLRLMLAPPRLIDAHVPASSSVALNQQWLREHAQEHRGRWIALSDGHLVSTGSTLNEVMAGAVEPEGMFFTKIH